MSMKSAVRFAVAVLLLAGVLLGKPAIAQDSTLADQLKAHYKLAKMGVDSSGLSVVDAGTVLVIQKGGILGVPPANAAMAPATYKDGDLHGPNAFVAGMMGPNTRQLTVGEKVYILRIDVHLKNDKVTLTIVECDSCNGVQQPSFYKSQVIFQFPKGYLAGADAAQIQDVINQVLAADASAGGSSQTGSDQSQPAAGQPLAQPATLSLGQSPEEVKAILGQPDKILDLGPKQIYIYKDVKITFQNGKVVDMQ